MKRKLIALALTLTTIFACFSMTMMSATADEVAEPPVVKFAGHQRTVVVADTTYGIRFVGTTTNLNAKKIIFNIALVDNAGNVARFNQEITTVYTAIVEEIDGTPNTITAAELGSNYIFSVVIPDVEIGYGYLGYLCSITYIGLDDSISTTDTYDFIYNNENLWADSASGQRVKTTYYDQSFGSNPYGPDGIDQGGTKKTSGCDDLYYLNDNNGDGIMNEMWDDDYSDWAVYGGIQTWGGNVGAYTAAYFDNPIQIERIALVSAYQANFNTDAKIQVSKDGNNWKTIYTITGNNKENAYFTASGNYRHAMTVNVEDRDFYKYIRIHSGDTGYGFSLIDVAVYSKTMLPGLETVGITDAQMTFVSAAGDNAGRWEAVSKDSSVSKDSVTASGAMAAFDGNLGTVYGRLVWSSPDSNTTILKGTFAKATKIEKVELTVVDRREATNIGAVVQASVHGDDWDSLFTINDENAPDFRTEAGNGSAANVYDVVRTIDFAVASEKEYQYIRVINEEPNRGVFLSEITVYAEDSACSATLKNLLANTDLEYQEN